ERINAINELGRNPEITRFKGLGEISPDEFKNFIGADIRLDPVIIGKDAKIDDVLEFYMGKNTPDRQDFIIENLRFEEIVEIEEQPEEILEDTESATETVTAVKSKPKSKPKMQVKSKAKPKGKTSK